MSILAPDITFLAKTGVYTVLKTVLKQHAMCQVSDTPAGLIEVAQNLFKVVLRCLYPDQADSILAPAAGRSILARVPKTRSFL